MVPSKRLNSSEPYHKQMRPYFNNRRPTNRNIRPDLDIQKSRPNNILRIKVLNAFYEVTTETLYYVFSTYGNVIRIVLFKSAGAQSAMVEYDSINAATIARDYLNGFNLFLSCNTLQVEFAWTAKLVVTVNDINKSWDYTMGFHNDYSQGVPQYFEAEGSEESSNKYQPLIIFSTTVQNGNNVMVVSGLLLEMANTCKLFNLLSLYGNVAKIQFIYDQPGTAVVQMFDQMSVEYCLRYLNQVQIGTGAHSKLTISWTNQAFQPNGNKAFTMPDGSCSFQDFTYSKNQRFLVPRPNYWIQPPSKILRFYNTPRYATKEMMMSMFSSENVAPKNSIFLTVEEASRTSRGLLEFTSLPNAIHAIMKFNNKDVPAGQNVVNYLKLAFSSNNKLNFSH